MRTVQSLSLEVVMTMFRKWLLITVISGYIPRWIYWLGMLREFIVYHYHYVLTDFNNE
jgi:hypothetical protein